MGMLGASLKQAVDGLIEVLGEIVQAYENLKSIGGGRALRLLDGTKTTSSERRTFVCTDAQGEYAAKHRFRCNLRFAIRLLPVISANPQIKYTTRCNPSSSVIYNK